MLNQVSIAEYMPAVLVAAAGVALLCLAITHSLLRTFLHARGVQPWTLRDTVASTMLITVGAALTGGATVLVALFASQMLAPTIGNLVVPVMMFLLGALCVRLGLLALRKLT